MSLTSPLALIVPVPDNCDAANRDWAVSVPPAVPKLIAPVELWSDDPTITAWAAETLPPLLMFSVPVPESFVPMM